MATQSIIDKDLWSLKQELLEKRELNVTNLILKEVYALGRGYCQDSQEDISYMLDILNMRNKNLNCLIKRVLRGEDVSKKADKELAEDFPEDYENNRVQNYIVQETSVQEEHEHEHIIFNTLPTLPTT